MLGKTINIADDVWCSWEAVKRKNIIGYFLNKNEKGICLIPMILGNNKTLQIDIDNYISINENEIRKIKIKNEDIVYKAITIILNNHTKYNLKTTYGKVH